MNYPTFENKILGNKRKKILNNSFVNILLCYNQKRGCYAGLNDTIYTALGIGHNTEVAATLYNVGAPATENISLGLGFKSAVPIPGLKEKYPDREFKFIVGSELLVGLEGNGVGNWTYVELSGRVPKINTRLTIGVDYGTRQIFGINQFSFIAAVE